MMHPPTALPRSLAEHINPPPVDPIIRDSLHAGGANGRSPSLLARLFRRSGRQAARWDELDDADDAIAVGASRSPGATSLRSAARRAPGHRR